MSKKLYYYRTIREPLFGFQTEPPKIDRLGIKIAELDPELVNDYNVVLVKLADVQTRMMNAIQQYKFEKEVDG